MAAAGVPIIPGTTEPVETSPTPRIIDERRPPVTVKAAGGGGGRGFRVALAEAELAAAVRRRRRRGRAVLRRRAVYLERYLADPRHVEVQVLADGTATSIHLGERDCSIQRRHQKLIEESPAPPWSSTRLRERIGEVATEAARAVGYKGAGTVEGLLDADGDYYFMEMNTRVQVEHCVTEMATGIDIVKTGIRVAAGEPPRCARTTSSCAATRSNAGSTPRTPRSNFAPAPGTSTPTGSRRARRARRLGCRAGHRGRRRCSIR